MNLWAPPERTEDEKVALFGTLDEEGFTNAAVGLWMDLLSCPLAHAASDAFHTVEPPPLGEMRRYPPLPEATKKLFAEIQQAKLSSDLGAAQRIVRNLYGGASNSPKVLSADGSVPLDALGLTNEEFVEGIFSRAALGKLALMADACRRELGYRWRYPESVVPSLKAVMREAFCNIDALIERFAFLKSDES
jgi:hypothetical protein